MIVWNMAEKFGWTLEYIRSLSINDLHQYMQIEDGRIKALEEIKGRKK